MTADKIAEARALIEPLTGHTPGPWAVSYPVKDRPQCAFIDPECGYIEGENYLAVSGICNPATAMTLAAAPALRDTVVALADLAEAQAQEIARLRKVLERIAFMEPDRRSNRNLNRNDVIAFSAVNMATDALGETQ